jgi:uncharacterized membrane protein YeaQ/YmgE (transglycosylase-associated protein family)
MDMNNLLIFLGVGAVSGWLAGLMVRGGGFGLLGDIVIGILGAVVGGYVFGLAGISAGSGLTGSIVSATVGAVVLLFLIRLVNRG